MNECECVWVDDGMKVYECEWCYLQYEDNCTCHDGEINVNCEECF